MMDIDTDAYFYHFMLPDGLHVGVTPLTFGRARLTTGGDWNFYEHGY